MTIKCVLVGIINNENTDDELRELEALVESSGGLEVVGRITQRRAQPEPHYYLGKGKLNTLRELITGLILTAASGSSDSRRWWRI